MVRTGDDTLMSKLLVKFYDNNKISESNSPLKRNLTKFIRMMSVISITIAALIGG